MLSSAASLAETEGEFHAQRRGSLQRNLSLFTLCCKESIWETLGAKPKALAIDNISRSLTHRPRAGACRTNAAPRRKIINESGQSDAQP